MRKYKKMITIIIACAMMLSMMPVALADEGIAGSNSAVVASTLECNIISNADFSEPLGPNTRGVWRGTYPTAAGVNFLTPGTRGAATGRSDIAIVEGAGRIEGSNAIHVTNRTFGTNAFGVPTAMQPQGNIEGTSRQARLFNEPAVVQSIQNVELGHPTEDVRDGRVASTHILGDTYSIHNGHIYRVSAWVRLDENDPRYTPGDTELMRIFVYVDGDATQWGPFGRKESHGEPVAVGSEWTFIEWEGILTWAGDLDGLGWSMALWGIEGAHSGSEVLRDENGHILPNQFSNYGNPTRYDFFFTEPVMVDLTVPAAKAHPDYARLMTPRQAGNPNATTFYVSTAARGRNDGSSWENAWQELGNIDWAAIKPGDVIYIDGGNERSPNPADRVMEYRTPLNIRASGTEGAPITIRRSKEAGRAGTVIFLGNREYEPLTESGGQSRHWQPQDLQPYRVGWDRRAINFFDSEFVVVDGVDWKGMVVRGANEHGIAMSGANNTIRGFHIFDNGQFGFIDDHFDNQNGFFWTFNAGYKDGSCGLHGIKLAGPNMTVEFTVINDNGEDSIQAEKWTSIAGFTIDHSWMYNARKHSWNDGGLTARSFNHSMHSDSFQAWNGAFNNGNFPAPKISNSIMGPDGRMHNDSGVHLHDLYIYNSLFITDTSREVLSSSSTQARNWTIRNSTFVGQPGAGSWILRHLGTSINMENNIFGNYTFLNITNAANNNGTVARDNIFFGVNHTRIGPGVGAGAGTGTVDLLDNTADGNILNNRLLDPGFVRIVPWQIRVADWAEFDYTPTNPEVLASGAGTTIRTVADLFAIPVTPGSRYASDADILESMAANILRNGLCTSQLVLTANNRGDLILVLGNPFYMEVVLATNVNNRNVSGSVALPDSSGTLVFDIRGNGSNVRVFDIIRN